MGCIVDAVGLQPSSLLECVQSVTYHEKATRIYCLLNPPKHHAYLKATGWASLCRICHMYVPLSC
jgi:hypothetical protein